MTEANEPPTLPRRVQPVVSPRLATRPLDEKRGLPVPAFAEKPTAGGSRYDFQTVDPRFVELCAEQRWCYVCREPIALTEDAYFLGDEQSYIQGYYPETLGHADCLVSALALCPWITNASHKRATERRLGQPRGLDDDRKPLVWVLASSRYYTFDTGNARTCKRRGLYPRRLRNARFFAYIDGALHEVTRAHADQVLCDAGEDAMEPPAVR